MEKESCLGGQPTGEIKRKKESDGGVNIIEVHYIYSMYT
jgi:hypothetical protein